MTVTVSSGVTSSGLSISAGDPLLVLSGGDVDQIVVLSGGVASLEAGAIGGRFQVSAGGVVDGPGELSAGTPPCRSATPHSCTPPRRPRPDASDRRPSVEPDYRLGRASQLPFTGEQLY
jgi:hypothetical protein